MNPTVEELLNALDRLPESERREAFSEILKRAQEEDALTPARELSATPLSEEDEELVHLAEMTFLELDAREAADGKS
jgi:hypothetical protein